MAYLPEEAFSAELLAEMERLTPKQREAIPRLVRALADGATMRELLRGEDRICAWSTYYRPRRGWKHHRLFQEALAQARREYDAARLRTAVEDAAQEMRRTTPLAAALLRRVIEGSSPALEKLLRALDGEEVGALEFRAADRLLAAGKRAATDVLDRADIETAVKSAGGEAAEWRGLLEELRGLEDEEEVADVAAEAGDLPAAGVSTARGADAGAQEPGAGGAGGGGGAGGEERVDGA